MTERELHDHESGLKKLVIRRHYKATPDDVWDAITDPDRLVRWFLPITGDLRVGGRYQLEGNASGEIVRCDRPTEIGLTWEMGGGSTDVIVRLAPDGDEATVLTLEHSPVAADLIPNASPRMWGLGAGWEMGLRALGKLLNGELPDGNAKDWIATASQEDLMAAGVEAIRISDVWTEVIGK
ncbi:SRPBCC family protein [Lentzea tibetensis]|uniref:SRPBCC family protein n=1 Tax=Lentzea tibetensis TaxID=2591470 RepID=A0A563EY18_9PSEU|nr:SRPBCC family protein [Lentzea tibetensis]TWP52620.1 SRPBCC family protein [Lentzea tibetensis]